MSHARSYLLRLCAGPARRLNEPDGVLRVHLMDDVIEAQGGCSGTTLPHSGSSDPFQMQLPGDPYIER